MDCEKQTTEYKSLLKIRTGDKGFKDLSVTCVALANAQGGRIFIGYDDKKKAPLPEQHVTPDEVNEAVTKLRSLCFNVGLVASEICTDDTGSQYFIVSVSPSMHSVATTSDGRIYIRVADKCEPVRSEDLQRLGEEKGAYQWELVRTKYLLDGAALDALRKLANDIHKSSRVRQHVKQMDDAELAENYHLVDEGYLTNLGVLWLGTAKQRSSICYPATVQYIVYDVHERKVRKEEWHDNRLNHQLTQKAFTAFGIIAREKKVFSTRLSAILQLQAEDRLRSYTDKLLKDNIIGRNGAKKGTQFFVNPQLIKNAKVNLKTTLKTVEPYVLKTLIMEDLRAHPKSKISEIAARLPEVDLQELRKMVYSMVDEELITEGARTDRRYALK